jgi:hypothetical protein
MNRWIVGIVVAVVAISTVGVAPAAADISPSALVFSDGFESGGLFPVASPQGSGPPPLLPGYRDVQHSGVQQEIVHTGSWAFRATNAGDLCQLPATLIHKCRGSYAYYRLPGSYNELWAGGWVNIVSRVGTVKLFGLRTGWSGSSIEVYLDQHGRVSVRNNLATLPFGYAPPCHAQCTFYGATTMATGEWHRIVLHAKVGNGTGSFDVTVDGVPVPGLTRTGQQVGDSPLGELRLGDLAVLAQFDIAIDDVVVSTSAQ